MVIFNIGDKVYHKDNKERIMIVVKYQTHTVKVKTKSRIGFSSSPESHNEEQGNGRVICKWENDLHVWENKDFNEADLRAVE